MAEDDDRRLELVKGSAPPDKEMGRVGLGLLLGLAIGHRPLLAAIEGRLAFESALLYFVVIVLIAVGSLLFLGVLYDRFSYREPVVDEIDGQPSRFSADELTAVNNGPQADDSAPESHEEPPSPG